MGAVDVQTYGLLAFAGMNRSVERTDCLRQYCTRATMQDAVWLRVAFDRHARNHSLRIRLENFNSHSLSECACAALCDQ
jgi:hypothetical protein